MTAVLLLVVFALLQGLPVVRIVDPAIKGASWLGGSFLIGSGLLAFELAILSMMGAGWEPSTFVPFTMLAAAMFWAAAWRLERIGPRGEGDEDSTSQSRSIRVSPRLYSLLLDSLTVAVIGGHFLFATIAPIAESDFMNVWGLKARTFWIAGGIDFSFLTSPWSAAFHVDYPILLPLVYDVVAIFGGSWDDSVLGAVTTLFGAAALLVFRGEFKTATGSNVFSALGTLGVSGLVLSPWIGLAEGPFAAYATAGVLLIRRGLKSRAPHALHLGALIIGCGALVKNEGLALVIAVGVGVLLSERSFRPALSLWPAFAIPWIWLIPKTVYGLGSDLGSEGVVSRVVSRLADPFQLLGAIAATSVGRGLMWTGLLLAVLVTGRRMLREELFPLTVILAQLAAYMMAYTTSPYDLVWHVTWSWERLVSHLTPLVVFLISIHLVRFWRGLAEAPAKPAE